jgi:hypothetical protein
MKTLFVISTMIFLSSCMHLGMVSTTHGEDHQIQRELIVEKEVIAGDIRAVAAFPPLQSDEDVVLTLKLLDSQTTMPISNARVYFRSDYTTHDHHHESHSEHSEDETTRDREVGESSTPGVYTISYKSSLMGEYTLSFRIVAIGEQALDPEINIETTRIVSNGSHRTTGHMMGGMMGSTTTTTYVIVGIALMTAMMVGMFVIRGSI